MKQLVLIFVIAVNSSIYSQTKIDYKQFNYTLLEKLVIDKINHYRDSLKLKTLYTSSVLRESYSCITASENAKQDKPFHTEFRSNKTNLYNELYNLTKGKCGSKNPSILLIAQSAEVAACINMGDILCNTYDEMANRILRGWLNSKKHKAIIETSYNMGDIQGPAGISCCVKKSATGKYYVAAGFILLGYANF